MFRITETLEAREVKRNTLERARLIAYDMVIRMYGRSDYADLGRAVHQIHSWKGKHLTIRDGNNFVTLEKQ